MPPTPTELRAQSGEAVAENHIARGPRPADTSSTRPRTSPSATRPLPCRLPPSPHPSCHLLLQPCLTALTPPQPHPGLAPHHPRESARGGTDPWSQGRLGGGPQTPHTLSMLSTGKRLRVRPLGPGQGDTETKENGRRPSSPPPGPGQSHEVSRSAETAGRLRWLPRFPQCGSCPSPPGPGA